MLVNTNNKVSDDSNQESLPPRYSIETDNYTTDNEEKQHLINDNKNDAEEDDEWADVDSYADEKKKLKEQDELDLEANVKRSPPSSFNKIPLVVIATLIIVGFTLYQAFGFYQSTKSSTSTTPEDIVALMNGHKIPHPHSYFRNLWENVQQQQQDGGDEQVDSSSKKPKEIIEVTNPFVPSPRYGKPVYKTILLNHTFANSYNHPK